MCIGFPELLYFLSVFFTSIILARFQHRYYYVTLTTSFVGCVIRLTFSFPCLPRTDLYLSTVRICFSFFICREFSLWCSGMP